MNDEFEGKESRLSRKKNEKAERRHAKKENIHVAYRNGSALVTVIPATPVDCEKTQRKLRFAAYCRVSTDSEM